MPRPKAEEAKHDMKQNQQNYIPTCTHTHTYYIYIYTHIHLEHTHSAILHVQTDATKKLPPAANLVKPTVSIMGLLACPGRPTCLWRHRSSLPAKVLLEDATAL